MRIGSLDQQHLSRETQLLQDSLSDLRTVASPERTSRAALPLGDGSETQCEVASEPQLRTERKALETALADLRELKDCGPNPPVPLDPASSGFLPVEFFDEEETGPRVAPTLYTESGSVDNLFASVFQFGPADTSDSSQTTNSSGTSGGRQSITPLRGEREVKDLSADPSLAFEESDEDLDRLVETDLRSLTVDKPDRVQPDSDLHNVDDLFGWYKWE
ncbi:MAG: hypothetical protein ACFCD0_27165 [Gemmataceae bacterium]